MEKASRLEEVERLKTESARGEAERREKTMREGRVRVDRKRPHIPPLPNPYNTPTMHPCAMSASLGLESETESGIEIESGTTSESASETERKTKRKTERKTDQGIDVENETDGGTTGTESETPGGETGAGETPMKGADDRAVERGAALKEDGTAVNAETRTNNKVGIEITTGGTTATSFHRPFRI